MKKKATDLYSVCRELSDEINSFTRAVSGERRSHEKPLATIAAADEFQRAMNSLNSSLAAPSFTDFVMGTRGGAYREMEKQIEALSRGIHATNFDRALTMTRVISEVYRLDDKDWVRCELLNRGGRPLRAGARELLGLTTEADSGDQDSEPHAPTPGIAQHDTKATFIVAPRAGEALIGFISHGPYQEGILGDLAEKFEARAMSDGPRRAYVWYWWQVAWSFGPFAWRWARRLLALDDLRQLIGW